MSRDAQEIPTTKRNKRKVLTLDNYYKEKIQSTKETGQEIKQAKTKPSPKNENWPQALEEFKSEIMRKMEEIWQEKWEIAQKEINSLKDRNSQLEKDAKKSNEMISKLETQIKQQETMKNRIDQIKKENQSLKTRIWQIEANDLTRQQEVLKQTQKNDKLEENMKYLTERITDQENRLRRDNLRIIGLPEKAETKIQISY